MDKLFWVIVALLCGAVLPIQAGLNAKLGKSIESPVYASLISFLVGSAAILIYLLVSRQSPSILAMKQTPWPYWVGGLLGAFYVTAIIFLFPKLGPALTFGLVVAGQMLISILLDHHNLLVAAPHPVTIWRVVGVMMVIGGVILIRKF